MSKPVDEELYRKVKTEVDKSYDKPSAYRSMAYTRAYMKAFREKYGPKKSAYAGKNPEELEGWRKEKWIDIKSFVENPTNPVPCGNAPVEKGEYPLCMPKNEAMKYSESELKLLMRRKSELGKRRLVKEAFLRDVLEPEKIPAVRKYKQKYTRDRRLKLAKPLPEKKAEKILEEPTMREEIKEIKEKEATRRRGRPMATEEEKEASRLRRLENIRLRKEQAAEKFRAEKMSEIQGREGASALNVEQQVIKETPRRFLSQEEREMRRELLKPVREKREKVEKAPKPRAFRSMGTFPPLKRNEKGEIIMTFD
jgi:hypothetical protein